ncbi:hypothetical protein O3M35_012838 [Rhynocoris fuscipes]|uniref:SAP domain-containing protein n=1 Tax=Rhynocoris fuscipes TaxID=488301 RepID=A0AAW1CFG8_9HEMI
MSKLTKETISELTIVQLKDELKKRGYKTSGLKKELINRLNAVVLLENAKADEEEELSDDVIENESDNDHENINKGESNSRTRESRSQEGCNADHERKNINEEESNRDKVNVVCAKIDEKDLKKKWEDELNNILEIKKFSPAITFKDVEGTLSTFTGDDPTINISNWLEEFEDTCTMCDWSEIQKIIYAKKLLSGSAKLFIMHQKNIKSWEVFKETLKEEFTIKINSKLVHRELTNRKKQKNETYQEYMYKMLDIGAQSDVEEDSLIQYIIDGIDDSEANKTILYGSRSLKEFREKLRTYETMKTSNKRRSDVESSSNRNRPEVKVVKRHCYGCGDRTHVNMISCIEMYVDIKLNNHLCQALVDTGSEVSLIRWDQYIKCGAPEFSPTSRVLAGFGNAETKPLGSFKTEVEVDGILYPITLFVVSTRLLKSEVLLGCEFLKDLEIDISKGKITLNPARKSEKEAISRSNKEGEGVNSRNSYESEDRGFNEINCIDIKETDFKEPDKNKIEERTEAEDVSVDDTEEKKKLKKTKLKMLKTRQNPKLTALKIVKSIEKKTETYYDGGKDIEEKTKTEEGKVESGEKQTDTDVDGVEDVEKKEETEGYKVESVERKTETDDDGVEDVEEKTETENDRVQRSIDGSRQRAIKTTPFDLKMRQKDDIKVSGIVKEEILKNHDENRNEIRELAKENILKIQRKNKRQYSKKRKKKGKYGKREIVSRAQLKSCGNSRYEVVKVEGEGPETTTGAVYMRDYRWSSSGTEENAEWPDVGSE